MTDFAKAVADLQAAKSRLKAVALGAGALLLASFVVAGFYVRSKEADIAKEAKRAAEADGRAKVLADAASAADGRAKLLTVQRDMADKEVQRLRLVVAKLPKPEPPAPVPVEASAVVRGLEAMGLGQGLTVAAQGPSSLTLPDARRVWALGQDAAALEPTQVRLAATENLVVGLGNQVDALKGENDAIAAARDRWQAAHGAQKDRADALDAQINAMVKKAKAQWWLEVGKRVVIAYAAYEAGRRFGK